MKQWTWNQSTLAWPTMLSELGEKWLVQYFEWNPKIIVNRFIRAEIAGALD